MGDFVPDGLDGVDEELFAVRLFLHSQLPAHLWLPNFEAGNQLIRGGYQLLRVRSATYQEKKCRYQHGLPIAVHNIPRYLSYLAFRLSKLPPLHFLPILARLFPRRQGNPLRGRPNGRPLTALPSART